MSYSIILLIGHVSPHPVGVGLLHAGRARIYLKVVWHARLFGISLVILLFTTSSKGMLIEWAVVMLE